MLCGLKTIYVCVIVFYRDQINEWKAALVGVVLGFGEEKVDPLQEHGRDHVRGAWEGPGVTC